jgi:hypothetical protein
MMLIGDMLRRDARLYAREAAIIDGDKKLAFGQPIEFCRTRLAGYKKQRSVDFVAELPRNAASKVDKAGLKKAYREKSSGK